jgi:hypothetical protein
MMSTFFSKSRFLIAVSLTSLLCSSLGMAEQVSSPRGDDHRIHVNVKADRPNAFLQRLKIQKNEDDDDVKLWVNECAIPCSKSLDNRYTYRVTGTDYTDSEAFVFRHKTSNVSFHMGSKSKRHSGVALTSVGGGVMGLGGLIMLSPGLMGSMGHQNSEERKNEKDKTSFLVVGGIVAGLGALLLIGGLTTMSGSKTKVIPARNNKSQAPSKNMIPISNNLWLSPSGIHF